MRTMNRRAVRDGLAMRNSEDLPDGIGGTITGGPREPIDLMQVLARANGASLGGAVSGAAQVVVSSMLVDRGRERGVALSDGSRISFASIADAGVLNDDEAQIQTAGDARAPGRERARVLAGV
jgi:hypothetical protein